MKKKQKQNKAILFTRVPKPGQCKTRLMPQLSADECCKLNRSFIIDELEVLNRVCDEVIVFYDGELDDLLKRDRPLLKPQVGSDIFERMDNAFRESFEADGHANYILFGSDIPMLDELTILEAFKDLQSSDVTICKSDDGGYFLIGLSKYTNVPFSIELADGGRDVSQKTIEACLKSGLRVSSVSRENLFDIDVIDDLKRLADNKDMLLSNKSQTYKFLESWESKESWV